MKYKFDWNKIGDAKWIFVVGHGNGDSTIYHNYPITFNIKP
jgi:hypothetical protein